MANPKISVIVPVYNTADYLNRCIDSICAQTLVDLQIILVNDGSTDGSPVICDHYAAIDGRVVVLHRNNGGVSSARNAGLNVAIGDYIAFVDSDDYIKENMLDVLYSNALFYGADISGSNFDSRHFSNNANKVVKLYEENILEHFFTYTAVTVWNKIYSKNIIAGLSFVTSKVSEDLFFSYELFKKCNKYVYTDECFYWYEQANNSATRGKLDEKDLENFEIFDAFINKVNIENPQVVKIASLHKYKQRFNIINKWFIRGVVSDIVQQKIASRYHEDLRILRKNIIVILRSAYFSTSDKLQITFLVLFPYLFAKLKYYYYK